MRGTPPPLVRVLSSTQMLLNRAALSSALMMLAAMASYGLANSPLAGSYHALLRANIGISFGALELTYTLAEWINDGLLALVFLWLGLTIKCEVRFGTVATTRAIILPTLAALGGVIVPAAIYLALNVTEAHRTAWAIPVPTDIALALGALALLGGRIPFALKVFLVAVAIVDNLIAVLVIAIFYSGVVNGAALGIGLFVFALLLFANEFGPRSMLVYVVSGFVIVVAVMHSGVHAAIAGLLVACAVPPGKAFDTQVFANQAYIHLLPLARASIASSDMQPTQAQQAAIDEFRHVLQDVRTPLFRMEHVLQPWMLFVVLPLFALVNAGATFSPRPHIDGHFVLASNLWLARVVGNPLGIAGATWLAVRAGVAPLPSNVRWNHIVGVSCLAGVGLTLPLLIGWLSIDDRTLAETAKMSTLTASLAVGSVGTLVLRWGNRGEQPEGA